MMAEYGRIHTDGSRSGGQPIPSKDCPKCERFGDDCGEHSPSWQELAAYWKAEAERLRQPTQSDALRDLVATLWCASGCSCCRDDDAWEKASHELAELLSIPKYDDGSGYDWYSVCDAAKGQSK